MTKKQNSTIFYIVRHGQSEGNVDGDIMGTDPPYQFILQLAMPPPSMIDYWKKFY